MFELNNLSNDGFFVLVKNCKITHTLLTNQKIIDKTVLPI